MPDRSQTRLGVMMGLSAYLMWGVLPLYFHAVHPVAPLSILSHRVVWSAVVLTLIVIVMKRWRAVRAAIGTRRVLLALFVSTMLIGSNWLLYIYAVNNGYALQASLGYFINPLVNVLLGVAFLRERLGRAEVIAIALALAGVLVFTIGQHILPLIPLGLALTFGLYGLLRKVVAVGPVEGLLVETGLLAPFALTWLLVMPAVATGQTAPPFWLLMLSGVITTVPLLLFNGAAKRIRYSDLGLLQYVGPTLQLIIAVRIFGEPLLPIHLIAFALIWAGLVVYGVATWRRGRTTAVLVPD